MKKIKDYLEKIKVPISGYRKRRSNSRRFKIFYLTSKADTRGNSAKIADFTITRFFVFFIAYIIATLRMGGILLPSIIAAIVLTIFHLISIKFRDKKLEMLKRTKRYDIASNKVYQELLNRTAPELTEYIEEFLKRNGFVEVENVFKNNTYFCYKVKTNKWKDILISFFIYKKEHYVETKEMKEFLYRMKDMNIDRGMVITTSDLTIDSYSFIDKVREKFNITAVSNEKFLKLIEGSNLYPTEEEIDEIIENKISKREASWRRYKEAALSKKKARGYMLISIFLLAAAWYSPFPIYYMAISGLSMGMAFIILIKKFMFLNGKEEYYTSISQFLEE